MVNTIDYAFFRKRVGQNAKNQIAGSCVWSIDVHYHGNRNGGIQCCSKNGLQCHAWRLPTIWTGTVMKNFPMALLWNLFAAGPVTRWMFRILFADKTQAENAVSKEAF